MSLHWTCSSKSMSLLYCGAQTWTQDSRHGLTSAELEGKDHLFWTASSTSQWSPGHCFHCLLQRHIAGPCSTCPSGLPGFFSAKLLFSHSTTPCPARSLYWFVSFCKQRLCGTGLSVCKNKSQEVYGDNHCELFSPSSFLDYLYVIWSGSICLD